MNILTELILVSTAIFVIYIIIPAFIKIISRKIFLESLKKECVYLTFDDGPEPNSTLPILSILKKCNVKATFFFTGQNLEKFPMLVKQIIIEGHGIGIHGYEHLHAWKTGPLRTLVDFLKFKRACKEHDIPIERFNLYRPPYGKLNLISMIYILITKKKIIFWNNDPQDYSAADPQEIISSVIMKLKRNRVILLHDGRSSAENSPTSVTINSLEQIITEIKKQGLDFCSFS